MELAPKRRPSPVKIDPKKFVGGENLEKVKRMLRDLEEFTTSAKPKVAKVEETFDRFGKVVEMFGDTVLNFQRLIQLNAEAMDRMGKQWKGTVYSPEGDDNE